MKTKTNTVCLALCFGLSTVAALIGTGCAGDRYDRSTGEYIDDNSVKLRVDKALRDNEDYKFGDVDVTVFRGTVQLSGFVDMSDQKSKAEGIAKGVEGVRNVVDNITISNPAGRTAGQTADDKDLEHRVQDALSNSPEYKFDEVEVNVSQGVVQLSGFVNTADQKSKAYDTAKGVSGVNDVNNSITVKDKL